MMKYTINDIATPMSHIINLTFSTGIIPDGMKMAKIIPIFKSGDKSSFNNYRPISILPAFSKIMEKIMHFSLSNFLNSTKQFYKHQYGFRKGHSTLHHVLQLVNHIAQENDKPSRNFTLATFLDLSKAFDTISHNILLHKLDNIGVRGLSNMWFQSYLSNRQQFMDINDTKSTLQTVDTGVPQGSILGPLLFLIYINDINNSLSITSLCFADDTTVFYSSADITDLYQTMNIELHNLNQWFRANRLSLNASKSRYMIFTPPASQNNMNNYDNMNIQIEGQRIIKIGKQEEKKSFKFLGLQLDEHLTWKPHIDMVCSKIAQANYMINRTKNILPHNALKTLYHSLIQSHINYGIEIWGGCNSRNKLFMQQKKAIRTINKKPYRYHTEPLFKDNNILKIEDHHKLNVSTLMYQMRSRQIPEGFLYLNYFQAPIRSTRQSHLANQHLARTNFTALQSFHLLPKIWNTIPPACRDANSVMVFKRNFSTYLRGNYKSIITCTNARCRQCNNL